MGNKAKKAQKRKAKRKQYIHDRNVDKNQAKARFRLEVFFPEEGWKVMAGFKSVAQCEAYTAEQEAIRAEAKTEILEGRIIDINSGRQVVHIPSSIPEDVQAAQHAKAAEPKGCLSDVKAVKSEPVSEKPDVKS